MSGEAELYYGIIITGLCVPPFVHYAIKFIRKGLPGARRDLAAMRTAARDDYERTKQLWANRGETEELDLKVKRGR